MLVFCWILVIATSYAVTWQDRSINFLRDFIASGNKPTDIVSFITETTANKVHLHKSWYKLARFAAQQPNTLTRRVPHDEHVLYLCDLTGDTVGFLIEAQKLKILKVPARWMLFYSSKKTADYENVTITNDVDLYESTHREIEDVETSKREVETLLEEVYVSLDSEVYVVVELAYELLIFLVHKLRPHLPLIWEDYGKWDTAGGFHRTAPREPLGMRRKNINGLDIYAATYIAANNSMEHMQNYLFRHIDTPPKISYYMTLHLFDWLNATGHINLTESYGYRQKDGSYNGVVKEMYDGRSEFAATVVLMAWDRLDVVEFVLPPCRGDIKFMFRKPSLASVANIYALPFSQGVWMSVVLLIAVLTALLFLASHWQKIFIDDGKKTTVSQRLSQCFHDTLCLAFQQGTAVDPIILSGRQVLFIGLTSFMFLYTAYSAFVVALLQSATNDINSVEALLNSPLQILSQDRAYNRLAFQYDTRPAHKALWLKKGAPQGESFLVSAEEGVRKMREGLVAFHVEETAGYDYIQKIFLEHEKCNLGTVKFMADNLPSTIIAKESFVKEPLRVGTMRIFESGLQSRSCRRTISTKPVCGAATAMFTPVSLLVALPVFKYLLIVCASTVLVLGLEVYVHRREMKRKSSLSAVTADDDVFPDLEPE